MNIRKLNFELFYLQSGGFEEAAELLGYTPGYISQLMNSTRPITEKSARKWEERLNYDLGWFDEIRTELWTKEGVKFNPDNIGAPSNEPSNVSKAVGYRPHQMPQISWVQAGDWCEAMDSFEKGDAEDWMLRPHNAGDNAYALKVQGDSMTSPYPGQRSYPEGTIIYIDPDVCVTSGKRVIAKIPSTNEATFKTYVEDAGQAYLKPINPQYDKIPVTADVLICGVVIGSYLPE